MVLASHEVASFSVFPIQKKKKNRRDIEFQLLTFCLIALLAQSLILFPFFKNEKALLGKVVIQKSFTHVFMRLNGLHKVEHMLKAFQDLEPR